MATLQEIPGIGKASRALLEAAGFGDIASLATADAGDVATALAAANEKHHLAKRSPPEAKVRKWIGAARTLVPPPAGETQPVPTAEETIALVDYEGRPEVAGMLTSARVAIPLPSRVLVANHLGVADIPSGLLLNAFPGDLDMRIEQKVLANSIQTAPKSFYPNAGGRSTEAGPKLDIDLARLKPLQDRETDQPRLPAGTQETDRISLLRAPKEETNRGKNPESRFFIRGVLHSHPVSVFSGAIVTLLLVIVVPLAVLASVLLLLSREMPQHFSWSSPWLLALPIALPVVGIAWLLWGLSAKCRICGIRLFVHCHHRKNIKAHHVPLLGYVIPLCLHILFFRWFRCTHCGTPVRLKS